MPATIPSTAKPVVTIEDSFMLSNGKSPVRINHTPSKSIPRFLPAKLFINAIFPPLNRSLFKLHLQFLEFFPGFTQDGDVRVGIFPQREEILVCLAAPGCVACQC